MNDHPRGFHLLFARDFFFRLDTGAMIPREAEIPVNVSFCQYCRSALAEVLRRQLFLRLFCLFRLLMLLRRRDVGTGVEKCNLHRSPFRKEMDSGM